MLEELDVRTAWEVVAPGIESIRSEMPWPMWRSEDIYAACLSGEAHILVQPEVGPQTAFLVVKIVDNGGMLGKSLFLWIAWSKDAESAGKVMGDLEDIARRMGCSSIDFSTGSPRLVQYAEVFGFNKIMYNVRKDVSLEADPL